MLISALAMAHYYGKFCSSCGPKIPMVSAAAKAHPEGFSTSELWEDLAVTRKSTAQRAPAWNAAAPRIHRRWRGLEASQRSWFSGAGEGERMITDPLQAMRGKMIDCWTPTCSFSAKLKSIHGTELWFEDKRGWRWLVHRSEVVRIREVRRC